MTLEHAKQSLRLLVRHKRFTATAIACLGLAIALNTTMYSVLDAVINPRIDIPEPDRLVSAAYYGDIRNVIPAHEKRAAFAGAAFHDGVAGSRLEWNDKIVERGSRLREAAVVSVTPNYFSVIRNRASAGRLLHEADMGAELRPVVISQRLWGQLFPEMERFEPARIFVGGSGRLVVGVLSQAASGPARGTDIWQLPLPEDPPVPLRVARLKPGMTMAQAETEMAAVSQRYRAITGEGVESGWLVRGTRPQVQIWNFHYALIGSVVAVLLIACANLANLQLARGVSRARELATRAAVGASRGDIVRQLVLESAWLAVGGLIVGAVLTAWGIEIIDKFVPRSVGEYMTYPQVSWRVAAFAVGSTVICLMLVGLLPAIRLSRVNIHMLLQSGAGTGKSVSARRQYGALVVVEVSLALMLLCSTGLLVKSAMQVNLFDIDDAQKNTVDGMVGVRPLSPTERLTARDWSARLVQHLSKSDSVVGAATSRGMWPHRRTVATYDNAGQPISRKTLMWTYQVVTPEYMRVNGFPVVAGRDFAPGEFAEPHVIVDSTAAKLLWPGREAIGQQIKFGPVEIAGPWYRVIGVAKQSRPYFNPNADEDAERRARRVAQHPDEMRGSAWVLNAWDTTVVPMPRPRERFGSVYINVHVRGKGDPRRTALLVRRKLLELGPNILSTYPQTWDESTRLRWYKDKHDFMATLFGVFAFSALALAALGVYAIIAHMVAQRTREFGVRIAVGAGERDIREMVIREGNVLTLAGIAIGLLITYKTAAWVRAFVFSDWDRYDSRVFAVVAVLLFGTAWLASYLPARKAMRINPVEALRNE